MGKVVINTIPGGFSLSEHVLELLGIEAEIYVQRHDPALVAIVEKLGQAASGDTKMCHLKVEEFEGDQYILDEFCGIETVITPSTMEWIDASK